MTKHIIYLASGSSKRFGDNKLLAELDGKPLYRHGFDMLKNVTESQNDCTLTVVSRYKEIREYAENLSITAVDSPKSDLGLSYTVKAGIKAISNLRQEDFLLFVVADQPYCQAESVKRLLSLAECGTETARLCFENRPGNPVLFSAGLVPELLELSGDNGGGAVAKRHKCKYIEALSPRELMDIDTIEDLQNLKNHKKTKHIVITGSKQIGKSTLAKRYLEYSGADYAGYRTKCTEVTDAGPVYALEDIKTGENTPISAYLNGRIVGIKSAFDDFGAKVILNAVNSDLPVLLFDEIGRFERDSEPFLSALDMAFQSGKRIIAVLKKEELPHIVRIRERADICLLDLDKISASRAFEYLKEVE